MNRWNNFCKPSLEENFSLIFGWKYYVKDFTMQEPFFQSFFYFSSSGRDFFPHLKVEILEDFTVEKSFSRFVFFSSTGCIFLGVYILCKRLHYAKLLFSFFLLLLLGEVFLSFLSGHFFARL